MGEACVRGVRIYRPARLEAATAAQAVEAATGGEAVSTNDSCSSVPVELEHARDRPGPWMNSTRQPACALAAQLEQRPQAEAVEERDAAQVDRGRRRRRQTPSMARAELVDGGEVDLALDREDGAARRRRGTPTP